MAKISFDKVNWDKMIVGVLKLEVVAEPVGLSSIVESEVVSTKAEPEGLSSIVEPEVVSTKVE